MERSLKVGFEFLNEAWIANINFLTCQSKSDGTQVTFKACGFLLHASQEWKVIDSFICIFFTGIPQVFDVKDLLSLSKNLPYY